MNYRVRNVVIAVALAVVAGALTLFYVTNYKKSVQSERETVGVLVVAKDIPAGTPGSEIIGRDMLVRREVARDAVVPGAISNPLQIRNLVAVQPVFAGEQVTARRFGPRGTLGIRTQLTQTMRAFQIAGDGNQVLAGTLRAGDHVDLVASIKYKVSDVVKTTGETADVDRVASRIVLRDLRVLKTSGAASQKLASNEDSWVVLTVRDTQAPKLFFVLKNGDWSLQLRPTLRPADGPNSVETIEGLLGDGLGPEQYRQLYVGRTVR
jgi:Flp pilus assembly protein CpaB